MGLVRVAVSWHPTTVQFPYPNLPVTVASNFTLYCPLCPLAPFVVYVCLGPINFCTTPGQLSAAASWEGAMWSWRRWVAGLMVLGRSSCIIHAVFHGCSMMRGCSTKRWREAGHRDGPGDRLPDTLVTGRGVRCRRRFRNSVEVEIEPYSLS